VPSEILEKVRIKRKKAPGLDPQYEKSNEKRRIKLAGYRFFVLCLTLFSFIRSALGAFFRLIRLIRTVHALCMRSGQNAMPLKMGETLMKFHPTTET
jgi:hypothetical protein